MKHRNCGGDILIDLTDYYTIRSPCVVLGTKGLTHGMAEITSSGKKETRKYVCNQCNESFSTKDAIEDSIFDECGICGNYYSPSKIIITDIVTKICEDCMSSKSERISTSRNAKLYALYGTAIQEAGNGTTLLTLLLRK